LWPNSDSNKKDRLSLGFKLTCAFELLKRIEEQSINDKGDNFKSYIENLETLGFFKGLLKDSKEYRRLYEEATLKYSSSSNHCTVGSNHFKIEDILNNIPNDYILTLNEEISLQKNKLIDDSEDWLKIDLDDKNFDDYLEMYSNGNVNSTYDFKLISDAFNKFLDLKKPKSTQSNVDFKNISNSDEELIDFDVNLIE
jgi:hypothetical protein